MKKRASVKQMCPTCKVFKRHGKVICTCKSDPKHKQTQG